MATITMPQLGETVTEGTVGRWLKREGEQVAKYEPLLEVETDKVASEIPSPFAGTLSKILAPEGTTVPVGAPVCEISDANVAGPEVNVAGPARPAQPAEMVPPQRASQSAPNGAAASLGGVRLSPVVRKLVRQHALDLRGVRGSGRGGRVTAKDVLTLVESPARSVVGPAKPAETVPPLRQPAADDTVVRLTPMRKTIAEHMVLSTSTIPRAWTMVEVDMSGVVRWREQEKAAFAKREGVNLTFLPIVVQAVCEGLKQVPEMNSTWGGDHIILRRHININIAIDLPEGLVTPVVRDADRFNLAGLAQTITELVEKSRTRKLTMDDLTGGTFTVDNTGALGCVASLPIINPPQAAIVTMEAIVKRPWVVGDAIAIRHIMNMCLCMDHRILDGAVSSRFLQAVKRRLEAWPGGP